MRLEVGFNLAPGDEAGVRHQLTRSLLVAALILRFGLPHPFLVALFQVLNGFGLTHRLIQAAVPSTLFLAYPVYLLRQAIPLVAYCATGARLPRSTGLMLFFSTFESFLGSVVSTLVPMIFLGVHITVAFTLGLLVLLIGPIGRQDDHRHGLKAVGLGLLILAANSPAAMRTHGIVSDNLYSQLRIHAIPAENSRLLIINNSPSSNLAARPEHRFA